MGKGEVLLLLLCLSRSRSKVKLRIGKRSLERLDRKIQVESVSRFLRNTSSRSRWQLGSQYTWKGRKKSFASLRLLA